MSGEVVFTITESDLEGYLKIKSNRFPEYNKPMIPKTMLFEVMTSLTQEINNKYNLGVIFDVE